MLRELALASLFPLTALGAQDPIGLSGLPDLARQRSVRQRPKQIEALEPFIADLELDPRVNRRVVASTVDRVAALGDGIVPLLLEKLSPPDGRPKSVYLAINSARVLARLEPISFLDTLIELVNSSNVVARQQALYLLGHAGHPRAAQAIAKVAAGLNESDDQKIAIEAMVRLDSPAIVPWSVRLLQNPESGLRRVVLTYLDRFGDAAEIPAVLEALEKEKDPSLLPRYVDFMARVSERDAAVAEALIPLTGDIRLDLEDQRKLCAALARIAPLGHKPTLNIMRGFLERGETSALGVTAAMTMLTLGDDHGQKILFDTLDDKIRKRRENADAYADRADAHLAFGDHREAVRDYERAVRYSRAGSRRAVFYLQIARCEAHRGQLRKMVRALEDSEVGAAMIRREAEGDPVFEAALLKPQAQSFLRALEGR